MQRIRLDRSCGSRDTTLSHSGRQRGAHSGGRHTESVSVGRRGPGRLRPFAGMAAATAGRQRTLGAHVSQAGAHLASANVHASADVRQAATINLSVEMIDARLVRATFGCGQEACQVAGRADDLQPSVGSGRVRRGAPSEKDFETVRKRVKWAARGFQGCERGGENENKKTGWGPRGPASKL